VGEEMQQGSAIGDWQPDSCVELSLTDGEKIEVSGSENEEIYLWQF
jgi:hypothetical protein